MSDTGRTHRKETLSELESILAQVQTIYYRQLKTEKQELLANIEKLERENVLLQGKLDLCSCTTMTHKTGRVESLHSISASTSLNTSDKRTKSANSANLTISDHAKNNQGGLCGVEREEVPQVTVLKALHSPTSPLTVSPNVMAMTTSLPASQASNSFSLSTTDDEGDIDFVRSCSVTPLKRFEQISHDPISPHELSNIYAADVTDSDIRLPKLLAMDSVPFEIDDDDFHSPPARPSSSMDAYMDLASQETRAESEPLDLDIDHSRNALADHRKMGSASSMRLPDDRQQRHEEGQAVSSSSSTLSSKRVLPSSFFQPSSKNKAHRKSSSGPIAPHERGQQPVIMSSKPRTKILSDVVMTHKKSPLNGTDRSNRPDSHASNVIDQPKSSDLLFVNQPKPTGKYSKYTSMTEEERISDKARREELKRKSRPQGVKKVRPEHPNYAFHEVVRGKDARKQMHASDCECCRDFYRLVGPILPPPELGRMHPTAEDRMRDVSRHRYWHVKPETPPGFWDVGMPSTQRIHEINEEARARKRAEGRLAHDI